MIIELDKLKAAIRDHDKHQHVSNFYSFWVKKGSILAVGRKWLRFGRLLIKGE